MVSDLSSPRPVAGLVGIREGKSHLKRRLQSIAGYRKPTRRSAFAGAILVVFLGALSLTDARTTPDIVAEPRGDAVAQESNSRDEDRETRPATAASTAREPEVVAETGRRSMQEKLNSVTTGGVEFDDLPLETRIFKIDVERLIESYSGFVDIANAMEVLCPTPARVSLEIRISEITRTESKELGFDWFLGNVPPNQGDGGVFPGALRAPAPASWGSSSASPDLTASGSGGWSLTGILTERQFSVVLAALEQRPGARITTVPPVTTSSGQHTRITQEMPDGDTLEIDCTTAVPPDGYSLAIEVSVQQIGVDGSHLDRPDTATGTAPPGKRTTESAVVWDGQTLILGGYKSESLLKSAGAGPAPRKNVMVAITPRILATRDRPLPLGDSLPFDRTTAPPPARFCVEEATSASTSRVQFSAAQLECAGIAQHRSRQI